MQYRIWTSGSSEDYHAVTSITGEPVINSMRIADEEIDIAENAFLPQSEATSVYMLWQYQKAKRDFRQQYLERWNATVQETGTGRPVDAIIAPAAPHTAVPHGMNQ